MAIDLREPESDADVEAWAEVSAAVTGTRWSLEEMRRFMRRESYRYLLALVDGEPAGAFVGGPSDLAGRAFAAVRVLPAARHRGVGSALLLEGVAHAHALERDRIGCEARFGDRESLAFAKRRGFEQWALEVELVRTLAGDETEPALPPGLEIMPLASRADLLDSAWELCSAAYEDLPLDEPLVISRERWLEDDVEDGRVLRELTLVAVEGGRVVAFAGMLAYGSDAEAAENGLTAVHREVRGRGLGTLIKQVQAARAARAGYRRLVTYTQEGNDAMRRVNERLGYVEQPAWVKPVAPVAAVAESLAR